MKNLLKHITLAVALIGSLTLADVASAQSMQGRGRPSSSQQTNRGNHSNRGSQASQPSQRGNSGGQSNRGGQV